MTATTLAAGHHRADGADRARRRRPPSPTQINLGWTASTDNVGVTGYRVERCQGAGCTTSPRSPPRPRRRSATPACPPATTYRYRVRAADAAGNLSAYSSIATATTPAIAGHHTADRARRADRHAAQRARSTWPGPPRPTTSASPATASSAARAPAARASPRSPRRPRRRTATPACRRRRPTATACAPPTPPATSAPTRPSPRRRPRRRPPRRPAWSAPGRSARAPARPTADASGNGNTGHDHGADWTTPGPLRQRAELQRHHSRVRVPTSASLN